MEYLVNRNKLKIFLDQVRSKNVYNLALYIFIPEKPIMSLPIPAKGPKVTSLIWNGLDDLIVTGHDNGDIVQVL